MKNLGWYFLLVMAVFSCKNDDIGEQISETGSLVTNLLEVSVDENYLWDSGVMSIIAITNSEEDLFIVDTIENGMTKIYESDFPVEEFNLTLFTERRGDDIDDVSYDTKTFIGLSPGQKIKFGESKVNGGPTVDIRVHDSPSKLCYVPNVSVGISSHMRTASLRAYMSDPIQNLYVILGSDDPLEKRRYIWHENVSEDFNYDIDYDELPTADNEVTFAYPSDIQFAGSEIFGLRDGEAELYECGCKTVLANQRELVGFSYPDNIFDEFMVAHHVEFDEYNTIYTQNRVTEIEEQYSLPNLRFEISEPASSTIEISSNEPYDIWTALYGIQNGEARNSRWEISGAYDDVVRRDLGQLLDEITSELGTDVYDTFDKYHRYHARVRQENGMTIEEFAKVEFDPISRELQDVVSVYKIEE